MLTVTTGELMGKWWPEHFQPRSGQEALRAADDDDRIATTLLDMFYLRAAESQLASLVAVVGCLGGTLSAVSTDALETLSDDVRDQVHMSCINQRNRFRLITARTLDVFKLEALRLNASGPGFNDPVQLFGSFQARISHEHGQASIALVNNEGRMTVGRIDLLHAIRQGIARPLVSAAASSTSTYHALISTGGSSVANVASSMMLLYSLADPVLGDIADNEAIFRNATYSLLSSLQGDMVRAEIQTPFAENRLPVPNRAQFIDELRQDGYEIRGNTAYKTDRNRRPPSTTLLGQVKHSVGSWFAPAIGLPLEANLIEYGALIDDALAQIATDDDRKAMKATLAVVTDGFSPTVDQLQVLPAVESPHGFEAQRTEEEIDELARALKSTARSSSPSSDVDRWTDDFTRDVRPNQHRAQRPDAWWNDFSEDAHTSITVPLHSGLPVSSEIFAAYPRREFSDTDAKAVPTHQLEQGIDFKESQPVQVREELTHDTEWKDDFR